MNKIYEYIIQYQNGKISSEQLDEKADEILGYNTKEERDLWRLIDFIERNNGDIDDRDDV